jgi:hypothetical protein
MPVYVLHHEHDPDECPAAYPAPSTCLTGGHAIWWQVEARDVAAALALLPRFVAARTRAIAVRDVGIP